MGKIIVGVLAIVGVTAGVGVVTTAATSDDAVVTRIVDGDTFEATVQGRSTSVRLLNIDTPETRDPDADVECLGPEAAARLAELLPVGSAVELAYDEQRTDGYGRTLAGVYDADDRLVNAELAREGLGTAVVVGGNDRFYDEVLDAQQEARSSARGLYATEVSCTVPARVDTVTDAVADLERLARQPPSDPAGLDRAAQRTVAVLDDIAALRRAFTGPRTGLVWAALSADDDRRLSEALTSARNAAGTLRTRWTELADAARERDRLAAEQAERDRLAAEQAERDRLAAEQAERDRLAAEQAEQAERDRLAREREQARVAAAEQRRRAAAPPAVTAPAAAGGGTGGGCDANYTPCVPISSSDLDCGDLSGGPYTVTGSDPHRLDNDDPDAIGCEADG